MNDIAKNTNLTLNHDIKILFDYSNDLMYKFLEENDNKIQYMLALCYSR